jgi:hypothetical protein
VEIVEDGEGRRRRIWWHRVRKRPPTLDLAASAWSTSLPSDGKEHALLVVSSGEDKNQAVLDAMSVPPRSHCTTVKQIHPMTVGPKEVNGVERSLGCICFRLPYSFLEKISVLDSFF